MDFTQVFPIILHPNFIEAFLIYPDLNEAVGPYPNAPTLLKCFKFYPKRH